MIAYLPFAGAIGICLIVAAAAVEERVRLPLTRVALSLFGEYVADRSSRRASQRELLHAAHVGETHRVYASRTLLYAGLLGVAGSVFGVYAVAGLLAVVGIGEEALAAVLPDPLAFLAGLARLTLLDPIELFGLLVASSATVGAGLAAGFYWIRWELLRQRAVARASRIDATLPRTVAFVYALSRSGTAFPQMMDTLAENEAVYGEAATELSVAVREMNAFGTDSLTALERTARRTPSEDLSEFAENLASVLGSGQSLSEFLNDQYRRYKEEAEAKQQQYLELLSTFAEAYVTTLVAGPLFFITILVVIGLVLENTLPVLRVIVYLGTPLATFGFVVYVDSVTRGVGGTERVDPADRPEPATTVSLPDGGSADGRSGSSNGGLVDGGPGSENEESTDGGPGSASDDRDPSRRAANRERLAIHDRLRTVLDWLAAPIDRLLRQPRAVLAVSVPIAVGWVALTTLPITLAEPTRMVDAADGPLVVATAVVFASYATVYEVAKRRTRRIERSVPDFLDRLASINEAGTSIVESVRRIARSDLDALTPELERAWRDVRWGSDVASALIRLDQRVRSPLISRTVTLVTNAMAASGDLGPVLRIAADESRATRRLQRERRQVMVTYLIVIYISFLVFLGIIVALSVAFIPAIEGASVGGGADSVPGGAGGITDGLGDIDVFAYEQLFFHAAAIQAVCSGIVAGQLGEGSVRDGVKHAVVLLTLAAVTLAVVGVP